MSVTERVAAPALKPQKSSISPRSNRCLFGLVVKILDFCVGDPGTKPGGDVRIISVTYIYIYIHRMHFSNKWYNFSFPQNAFTLSNHLH